MIFEKTVKLGDETIAVNWLMYKSYEFQRDNAPHIEAERWKKLYLYQEEYEKIYQTLRSKDVCISKVE